MASSSASTSKDAETAWTLPIPDNELNRKHIREEFRRLCVELENDELGHDQKVMLHRLKRKRLEEEAITFSKRPFDAFHLGMVNMAKAITYVTVDSKNAVSLTKGDYECLMMPSKSSKANLETVVRQVFGYGNNDKEESVYDVLRDFHNVASRCAIHKLEGIEQTREEYVKSVEMRRFWYEQLKTLELQEEKEMEKNSNGVRLSDRETERYNEYVAEEQKKCFIVQACETMKYMLDSIVYGVRVRSVKSVMERITKERNTTIDDDLPTDEEGD